MIKYALYNNQSNKDKDVVLRKVSYNGVVCGEFLEVSISQMFENKGRDSIDGVYIFPMPDTAVLTGFQARLGGKTLTALVEDKVVAEKMYEDALGKGLNPLSIESFEEGYFKVSIGSILPGETVTITLKYMDQVLYENNRYKITLPSVIGPQKLDSNPEEGIEESTDYKFSFNLLIESLCKIYINSPTHKINVECEDDTLYGITLDKDEKLDRDFMVFLDESKNYEYSGMIYPYESEDKAILYLRLNPKLDEDYEELPQNYIFLLDISESMEGFKIEEAKNALQLCIRNLDDNDTFNIIAFNEKLFVFSKEGNVPFTEESIQQATEWIEELSIGEGADIFESLKFALNNKNSNNKILLFTDDLVDNENEILEYVEANLGDNRIFPIGIDTSVNSYFINKLAKVGYGIAEFIYPGERIDHMILRQFHRINNPQLDVLAIDWGALQVEQTYPRTIEYIYDREPFTIFAKVRGDIGGKVKIIGQVGNNKYEKTIDLDKIDLEASLELIEKVWSRKRIESIKEHMMGERGDTAEAMRRKIVELSKSTGIISSETTFLMLEQMEEPVLGMSINNLIPVKISEETIQNISDAYFLDSPGLLYTLDIKEKMNTEGVDKEKAKEYIKYDRDNLLRVLAKAQSVDGGFYNSKESNIYKKVNSTLITTIAFIIGEEDVNIYVNQLNKAFRFITNYLQYEENLFDGRLSMLALVAFKTALERNILKGRNKSDIAIALENLEQLISERKYKNLETIDAADKLQDFKNIVSLLLGVTKEYGNYADKIISLEDKNNIYELAKIALSKAL